MFFLIFLLNINLHHILATPNFWVWGCDVGNISYHFPFCNYKLTIGERVSNLIDEMTMTEKIGILGPNKLSGVNVCNMMDHGVPRLGIPPYMNLVETNSAVAAACIAENICATQFPSPAGLAAAFNRTLWKIKGVVISDELRAFSNHNWYRGTHDKNKPYIGLTGFGPNINLIRDPRWGRNSEVPSEDPYLSGMYAKYYVQGMQGGNDPKYLKMISGVKHFLGYSVETNRNMFIPNISVFDLWDSYLAQFKIVLTGGKIKDNAIAMMSSYSGYNGIPSCDNDYLVNQIVRNTWGRDDLLVVTDCGAIENSLTHQKYVTSFATAAAAAINGGTDLELGDTYFSPLNTGGKGALTDALQYGYTTETQINAALRRVLQARFQVGLFDPLEFQPYSTIPITVINSTKHQDITLDAALQSFVLLKNDQQTLPLRRDLSIAVLGPHISSTRDLYEDYSGDQYCFDKTNDCIKTIGATFSELHGSHQTILAQGVELRGNDRSQYSIGLLAARKAKQILLFLGLGNEDEKEGLDRQDLRLPGLQEEFAMDILALKKPTVIVLINGGMLAVERLLPYCHALLEAFYPGQRGAEALFQALFGLSNKFGKLPFTMYKESFSNEQKMTDFDMTASPGRTYRYYSNPVNFPFGYGLSYTTFEYSCRQHIRGGIGLTMVIVLSCEIWNTGDRDGEEVLQVYHQASDALRAAISHHHHHHHPVPFRSLIDFHRIFVPCANQHLTTTTKTSSNNNNKSISNKYINPSLTVVPLLPGPNPNREKIMMVIPLQFIIPVTKLVLTDNLGDKILYQGKHHLLINNGISEGLIFEVNVHETVRFPSMAN